MTRQQRITAILSKEFAPVLLELRDDSAKHAGHAGASPAGETHYHLIISSALLAGKSRVLQHQAIYSVLADEFSSGLHALSIEIK